MQEGSIEHADVPYLESAIGVPGGQSAAVIEGNDGGELFPGVVGLPDQHFWPM